jgi:hypothetical protein
MIDRWVLAAMVIGGVLAAPPLLSAQQQPMRQAQATQKSKIQDRVQSAQPSRDVEELTPGQIQRAQEPEPPPPSPGAAQPAPKAPGTPAKTAVGEPPTRIVACSGAFARESSHLKLATIYNSQNIAFTDVEGPGGSKIMATVLFPKDAKGRLEVWWEDEGARTGTHLIVINGKSTWMAPKGLKLGLPLAAIEKLNGKPFKLKGFDKDGSTVTDWQGGALAQLPGGCKVGIRLLPDPKAPAAARSAVAGSKEFASSDANMRALNPAVAEIILGY